MAIKGISVVYCVIGGTVLFSGIKGATLSDTAKGIVTGNIGGIPATQAISVKNGSGGTNQSSATGPAANGTAAENQATAKSIATQMGLSSWTTGQEWQDWVSLWNQESGWSGTAQNPTSTAYGIAQFLDTTWGSYGPKTSDVSKQIKYGIEYIHDRYGSPVMAWAHEQANNWY